MIILSSCTVNKSIIGNYSKVNKGYKSMLVLKKDSTFVFTEQYFEVDSKCQGKWMFESPEVIVLKCKTENFPAEISAGYISEREKRVSIISSRKLQIEKVILSKVRD